jgi:hypothetical protein
VLKIPSGFCERKGPRDLPPTLIKEPSQRNKNTGTWSGKRSTRCLGDSLSSVMSPGEPDWLRRQILGEATPSHLSVRTRVRRRPSLSENCHSRQIRNGL